MAETDGSIRIGVLMDTQKAKKQMEELRGLLVKQTKGIDAQAAALKRLEDKYTALMSSAKEPKGMKKLQSELKKAEEEAAKLDSELAGLSQFAELDKAAHGEVSPETASKIKEITQRMNEADAQADELQQKLQQMQMPPESTEEANKLAEEIEEAKNKLNEMQLGAQNTKERIQALSDTSQSWPVKLGGLVQKTGKIITKVASKAGSAIGSMKKRVSDLGREKGFDKAGRSTQRFGNRLKSILAGALFFNIISRGLTSLTEQLKKYLTVNDRFSDALSGIKSNLPTAFQPVYNSVLPALTAMMEALENVTAKFASFMAAIFGTTASKAQESAKDLYDQANATEEAADAAEKAEKAQKKYLASFDTIERLGDSDEKSSGGEDKDKPQFNTDFEQIQAPQWLLDFWKVFQDGWNQYGTPTVQAFKNAVEAIKGAIAGILSTFLSVWTDGTGLEFLGRVYQLLQTIFGIVGDIAAAFMAAWDNKGTAVVEALFYMLNSVLDLIISIGSSFREAWNDGTGAAICETILQIITNIFNTVGNLASRLREAWEANGNGEAIWSAILEIIKIVLETFEKITGATAEWAENLDLEPLITSIRNMLEALVPVVRDVGDAIARIFEEKVLPFLKKVIEVHLPSLIQGIANLLGWLGENQRVVEVLTEVVLAFIAAWKVLTVIQSIHSVVSSLNPVLLIIQAILAAVILLISNFDKIADAIGRAMDAIGKFFGWLLEQLLNATKAFAEFIASVSTGSVDLPVVASVTKGASGARSPRIAFASELAAYSLDGIPHLAGGAVISPNNEFLAVLGDQRSGTNIETPMPLMKQAFLEALAESGVMGGGSTDINVRFTGSFAQIARYMQPEITAETRRLGPELVL